MIGMFTFGGGLAMIALIQDQVVSTHGWISEACFADIVAISQVTPGPIGINCATYVGYEVINNYCNSIGLGVIGSFVATFALVLPSFLIVFAIVKFYTKFRDNAIFNGVMSVLKPAVAGMIGAAALILIFKVTWTGPSVVVQIIKENFRDWTSWTIALGGFVAAYKFKVSPILLIAIAGVLGIILY